MSTVGAAAAVEGDVRGAPRSGYSRRHRPEPERRTVQRRRIDGTVVNDVVLDPEIFGIEPHTAVLHQVVTAQLAAARSGTQSTRTRAEVSGGGTKPFRQKGTGRARQGSIRAPQWIGGGIALGPKPRSYAQRTPKKMIRLALNSALSDRAAEARVALVESWSFDEPRTKDAIAALDALGIFGQVLVVLGPDDGIADRSFSNLPHVRNIQQAELNAYDVMRCDWIVFTDATLPGSSETVESTLPEPEAPAGSRPEQGAEEPAKAKRAAKAPSRRPRAAKAETEATEEEATQLESAEAGSSDGQSGAETASAVAEGDGPQADEEGGADEEGSK